MLRTHDEALTLDELWSQLPCRAGIPSQNYLDVRGPAPAHPNERRRFVRFRYRGRAIVERDGNRMAGYTVDVSRSGMGIISPVQLFPSECVQVTTVRQNFSLTVVWCVRLGQDCYQCGCKFQHG